MSLSAGQTDYAAAFYLGDGLLLVAVVVTAVLDLAVGTVIGLPPEVSSRPPRQDGGRSAAPMEASVHRPAPSSKSLV